MKNQFLKFILGYTFTFKAYAKNVREKTTKCSLKTDIYQSTVAPNCFKNTETLDYLISFKKNFCLMSDLKFTMSEVTFRLLQFLVFYLNSVEGKSDENDDSDFETLLHFETIETYCYCSNVISVSNKRTKKNL